MTTYTKVYVLSTSIDHNNHNKMVDNWIPVRQHNRSRGIQRGGGKGGRVGRPSSPGLEQRPPGSPIAHALFVHQGRPSCNDNILNTFLEVLTLYLILAFHCITVVLAHVKNAGCGFISKIKNALLKFSQEKYTNRLHNIHRHRLLRAVPIILLIIISNAMTLAAINIRSHEGLISQSSPTPKNNLFTTFIPDSLAEQRRNYTTDYYFRFFSENYPYQTLTIRFTAQ
jgi:hypothetical protein